MNNANISEAELTLLTYLHEHAKGYTEEFGIPAPIAEGDLQVPAQQLGKDLSYLVAHGLAGRKVVTNPGFQRLVHDNTGQLVPLKFIMWISGDGENFMRELEAQPGVARRLTTTVLKSAIGAFRLLAIELLKASIKNGPGHP